MIAPHWSQTTVMKKYFGRVSLSPLQFAQVIVGPLRFAPPPLILQMMIHYYPRQALVLSPFCQIRS